MSKLIRKFFTVFLILLFSLQQSLFLTVLATDITGVEKVNGVYDINPTTVINTTGFRNYEKFDLSQGDIANLIYKVGGYDKFINLVQNGVNINGLLNTVNQSGGFYNGRAIFVSPNGIVIGASGVLNVGALSLITPTQATFDTFKTKYTGVAGNSATFEADSLGLKNVDQTGNVTINGRIFARDGVEIQGKNITIGNTTTDKAAIFAGIDKAKATNNTAINSAKEATDLFNSLVRTNIVTGNGFSNENGKIVIKAQSLKTITMDTPTTTEGVEAGAKPAPVDPTTIDTDGKASVTVDQAILGAKDIDISATSKVVYNAKKGSPSLDLITNPDTTVVGQLLANGYANYEGARAKAKVDINSGAELVAANDVSLNSLAIATTTIKAKPLKLTAALKIADVPETYYATGTKTVSEVKVNDGSSITAKNNLKINATSKNAQWIKIANMTTLAEKAFMPNIQVVVVNETTDATTNAIVENHSTINAGNLNVAAVNETNDFTAVKSAATYCASDALPSFAITATVRNANINTTASVDTAVNTYNAGNVSVTAQNINVASNVANAAVSPFKEGGLMAKAPGVKDVNDAVKQVQEKVSGILGTFLSEALPNVGVAVVVNNSNVNTTATICKNANIHANNVNLNANTVDITVNNATAKVKDDSASVAPVPGVAVIVNNQNNNTRAIIEDGTSPTSRAVVVANNDLNVNATTEQPMNERTFQFLLNVVNAADDIGAAANDMTYAIGETVSGTNSSNAGAWNLTALQNAFKTSTGEVLADVKNVRVDLAHQV